MAYKWAPTFKKFEKLGKILLIVAIIGLLIYLSQDKFEKYNKQMNNKYQSKADSQWEDGENDKFWILKMITERLSDNFSWFAFKEMGFYIILTIFSLVGFGVLNHYNVKHDLKMAELQKKIQKEKENSTHNSNLSKKND